MSLRVTTDTPVFSRPDPNSDQVDSLTSGEEIVATKRSEDAKWLNTPIGWVYADAVRIEGDAESLEVVRDGIRITSKLKASLRQRPSNGSSGLGFLQRGESATALGRSKSGFWLETANGWIVVGANPRMRVDWEGDLMSLPVTDGSVRSEESNVATTVQFTPRTRLAVRHHPRSSSSLSHHLQPRETVRAIGRTANGWWLEVDEGWILVGRNPQSRGEISGDRMSLPVTDGSVQSQTAGSSTTRASRPTPTPKPSNALNGSTIRTLVSRHTDDIRILDLEVTSSTTTIEYDLKPWPFVPNEQIANEVAFKIICAIRKSDRIPNTLKLIGQGHFRSEVGRKFKSPSVEIRISAAQANRIVCAGNNHTDINWRSVSSVYRSYPIPRGASVDYG